MIEPTEAEKASAAARQKLADIERARLVAAMAICPGGKRFARWVLVDKSGALDNQIAYCADYGDGRGWQPSVQNKERLEDHPGFTTTGGFHYKPMRWNHCFQFIGEVGGTYKPRTAEQLAALRHTRETPMARPQAPSAPPKTPDFNSGAFDQKLGEMNNFNASPKTASSFPAPPTSAPAETEEQRQKRLAGL
jgi:hypothetical protein